MTTTPSEETAAPQITSPAQIMLSICHCTTRPRLHHVFRSIKHHTYHHTSHYRGARHGRPSKGSGNPQTFSISGSHRKAQRLPPITMRTPTPAAGHSLTYVNNSKNLSQHDITTFFDQATCGHRHASPLTPWVAFPGIPCLPGTPARHGRTEGIHNCTQRTCTQPAHLTAHSCNRANNNDLMTLYFFL